MLYPLTFQPILKERVWGGYKLALQYGKPSNTEVPIGESWEITDRPEGVSVIANGPLAGKDLHWLMEHHQRELLGPARAAHGRFPLLCKIIDAQEDLSLQVHPPADKAASLGGEAKTEAWFFADATPKAQIFVGLKQGVTRAEFERKVRDGSVAECFHRHSVKRGDAMFLPSGRVHALGAGCLIFEIQQNSDTTYRVFDWNRTGLDGKPRQLHIREAMESIDFNDFEPALVPQTSAKTETLVQHPLFQIERRDGGHQSLRAGHAQVIAVIWGSLTVQGAGQTIQLRAGQFCLIPASVTDAICRSDAQTTYLVATPG